MVVAIDPKQLIVGLAVIGLGLAGFWRLIIWVRDAPAKPDPWDAETQQKLSGPDAVQVCHHCFTAQTDNAWFCGCCGSAVGPYNNLMPYVCIFSEGEVFRNATSGKIRASLLTVGGYVLLSLTSYALFAPIFWFSFFKNLKQSGTEKPSLSLGKIQ
jgi:hypothetical protein